MGQVRGKGDSDRMKSKQVKIFLAATVCHVFWGFSFLASRRALDAAPVLVLLSHRFLLAFLVKLTESLIHGEASKLKSSSTSTINARKMFCSF